MAGRKAHKPVKGNEEWVVIGGQLYRKTYWKVGAPESNRFTSSGSGLRGHLKHLHGDFPVLEEMGAGGELARLDAPIVERLAGLERERGLVEGSLRRGRRSLPEGYLDLKRRVGELAPTLERYGIEVPFVPLEHPEDTV